MPNANGDFKGQGWSRKREEVLARILDMRDTMELSDFVVSALKRAGLAIPDTERVDRFGYSAAEMNAISRERARVDREAERDTE